MSWKYNSGIGIALFFYGMKDEWKTVTAHSSPKSILREGEIQRVSVRNYKFQAQNLTKVFQTKKTLTLNEQCAHHSFEIFPE